QQDKSETAASYVRTKVRKLRKRNIQDKTDRDGEKVKKAHIDRNKMHYLYASGDMHAFIDMNTYDQIEIPESLIENELKFIKENSSVDIVMFEGEVIGLDLPKNVEL